jgi:hypothetical protein
MVGRPQEAARPGTLTAGVIAREATSTINRTRGPQGKYLPLKTEDKGADDALPLR